MQLTTDSGTKAAKKNQKRRAAKKTRPEDVNESDEATATRESIVPQSQEPFDPIADIKQKIEQAKAAKVCMLWCHDIEGFSLYYNRMCHLT